MASEYADGLELYAASMDDHSEVMGVHGQAIDGESNLARDASPTDALFAALLAVSAAVESMEIIMTESVGSVIHLSDEVETSKDEIISTTVVIKDSLEGSSSSMVEVINNNADRAIAYSERTVDFLANSLSKRQEMLVALDFFRSPLSELVNRAMQIGGLYDEAKNSSVAASLDARMAADSCGDTAESIREYRAQL